MAKEFVHNHVEPLELILHACLYALFLINDVIIWFSLIFWFCVVEITRSISVTEKIKDYCISLWTVCVLFFPFNSVVFISYFYSYCFCNRNTCWNVCVAGFHVELFMLLRGFQNCLGCQKYLLKTDICCRDDHFCLVCRGTCRTTFCRSIWFERL